MWACFKRIVFSKGKKIDLFPQGKSNVWEKNKIGYRKGSYNFAVNCFSFICVRCSILWDFFVDYLKLNAGLF